MAVEILDLTSQPKVDLTKLKKCLLRDPALIGKLFRVVNSSLFGLSREVADLNQTLALLGTKSLRLLVLGFSLPDKLFVGLGGHVLQRYWHFTAIKAAASREIAETIFRIPGDEAFIAGLLQDLGMLALMQQIGEPYIKFLERSVCQSGRYWRRRSRGTRFRSCSAHGSTPLAMGIARESRRGDRRRLRSRAHCQSAGVAP